MKLRGGRYEILGTIATGGMATVSLGRALGAGGFERLVALKTMHAHLAAEEEFVAMFLDEARLAARIRHPNVVATLDVQQDEEGLFLVMEYVEGPSLSRLLRALVRKESRLPLDIAVRIFSDSLAGLHAAHELTGTQGEPLQLIHRDVSPHNVLVGTDGISRITDFGVARATTRLANTRAGNAKGKPMYMGPEQARAEDLDRRADVYSAGVVLWEMLTLQRLVRADSDMGIYHQITQAERKTPHEIEPSVPVEISDVCMHAIDRDRDKRYPTAAAFAEALEKAAVASGIVPASPRAVAQLVRDLDIPPILAETPSSSRSGAPPNVVRAPIASIAGAGPSLVVTPPGGVESAAPPSVSSETAPITAGTSATFSSQVDSIPPPPMSRRPLFIGIAVAVMVGALAILLVAISLKGSGESASTASTGGTADSTASPATTAPQAAPATATLAPATSASAAPTASAAPQPQASAAPSGSPKAGSSAAPGAATSRPGNSKTFRPKEL